MDTTDSKLKGDIAEKLVEVECLKRRWQTLKPTGDRSRYDLVIELNNKFIKIQVKGSFTEDNNIRTKKANYNQKIPTYRNYKESDFDFVIAYWQKDHSFHIFPVKYFVSKQNVPMYKGFKSKYGPDPGTRQYREAWHLIEEFAKGNNSVKTLEENTKTMVELHDLVRAALAKLPMPQSSTAVCPTNVVPKTITAPPYIIQCEPYWNSGVINASIS